MGENKKGLNISLYTVLSTVIARYVKDYIHLKQVPDWTNCTNSKLTSSLLYTSTSEKLIGYISPHRNFIATRLSV